MRIIVCLLITGLISCDSVQKDREKAEREMQREEIAKINKDEERSYIQAKDIPNVIELIAGNDALGTFTEALMLAEKIEELQADGPYTIFAPSNEAFDAMDSEELQDLLNNGKSEELATLINAHVYTGSWKTGDDVAGVQNLNGTNLYITKDEAIYKVFNAQLLSRDISASNGTVHVIDQVIQTRSTQ